MALLSKLQKYLDDRRIRSTAVQHGKTLALRGTFKQRDGSSKRMRVSLELPAVDEQLIHAESRASEFWSEYQRLGYLPDPMPWVVKVTPLPLTQELTVAAAVSQLEADFYRGKEGNAQQRRTWARIADVLQHLNPVANAPVTTDLLVAVAEQCSDPQTRGRQDACKQFKRLAKLVGLKELDRFDAIRGDYKPKQRSSFDESLLIELIDELRDDGQYGWMTAALFVYGTRPAETWSLIPKDNGTAFAVNLPKGKPPHPKYPLALPQELVSRWRLLEVERRWSFDLGSYDSEHAKYLGNQWCRWVQVRAKRIEGLAGLQLMDLRHAWGIRSIHADLDPRKAAKSMGHSIEMHYRTYNSTYDEVDAERAAAALNKRQQQAQQQQQQHSQACHRA